MTSTHVPADQDVRDRIAHELQTSFFIEAGAGSGKTSVLVARVINLVRSGVPLPQIVAITFTEKAAGELRERIRTELAKAGLEVALRDADTAQIGTIHAFCAGILRERAIEAGLNPEFRVLDQLQTDLRLAQRWRAWLWSDAAPQEAIRRALDLGLSLEHLQAAAEALAGHRDLSAALSGSAPIGTESDDRQAERNAALDDLVGALQQFVDEDAQARRREGVLSYDDLLLETRDLLQHSQSARIDWRGRYRTLLIDEFQDTDPLQAQIALLLAADPDTDDWTQARPGLGRLIIAGDPKQSIYRFRRADIDIYEQVRERFTAPSEVDGVEAPAGVVRLNVNFRARPQLSAWQNRTLERVLIADPHHPQAQARWSPTVPYRTEAGRGVSVITTNEHFARIGEARQTEARLIANLITHIHQARTPLGQLPTADATEPPQFRDIAILVRARTAADLYTEALDRAGIPYHFDSGQGFYDLPEIRTMAQLLQALDDPADSTAAIATLKSPLGAASDSELFELYQALDGAPIRLDPEALPDSYKGRLREPIARLAAIRDGWSQLGLPELIDHTIRRSELLLAQAVGARSATVRQRQANLRALILRAANFSGNGEDGLRPFIRWLSQRDAHSLPESESATTEADDDAVRILTIHQAKGLEFPVVILPKLQDQPGGWDRPQFIVDRPNRRLEFQLGEDRRPFRTSGYGAARQRELTYADAEARRMLYVAATRARDWLILTDFPAETARGRDSFRTYLDDAAPYWLERDTDPDSVVLNADQFDAVAPAPANELIPPFATLRQTWQASHQAALEGGQRTIRAQTPSSLHQIDAEVSSITEFVESAVDQPQARDPLRFGSALHEALATADLSARERTRGRAIRIAERYNAPVEMLLEELERALDSELMQRAACAAELHRELPLTTISSDADGTVITEGIADLIFRDERGWVLVDYKSDRELSPQRHEAYAGQVQRYAQMLTQSGITVSEAYLLLTASGEAVEVPLPATETYA